MSQIHPAAPDRPATPPAVRRGALASGSARAFTLVELLVVIGIIALLVGILMPVLARARDQARKTKCLANLRSIGQELFSYANNNRDKLPNGNPPGVWADPSSADWVMVRFAEDLRASGVFHCPSDKDDEPDEIAHAVQNKPKSARVSYEFYSLYFPGHYGPRLSKFKGRAPLAWDLDGGPRDAKMEKTGPSPDENHGPKGGHVVFADGHVEWQDVSAWDGPSWPSPAKLFYP